jgi:hypothetical protein
MIHGSEPQLSKKQRLAAALPRRFVQHSYRNRRVLQVNWLKTKAWLPGMDSNYELDRILKSQNLLILKSRRKCQKHQKQASGTKSVQKYFDTATGNLPRQRLPRNGVDLWPAIAMAQHALNRLRIDLPLVHKPGAQAVTDVVKTEPLPFARATPALVAAGRR